MFKCIVIDDEPLARSLLEGHIADVPVLEHLGSFKSAVAAHGFLQTHSVDVLFLDIQMPKLTGLDFLKTLTHPPQVILTTAYREYAVDSYEFGVVDYLLKPITFERFFKAIGKLQQPTKSAEPREHSPRQEAIFVQANKKQLKINLAEVLYIESLKDYVKLHLADRRVVVKEPLNQLLQRLPNTFLRVHRSYVVNTDQVTAFTAKDVEIGTLEIPIGGTYKEGVLLVLKA
ncbi:LytTR family DNA-binding domain-containing protein [Flagellimonas sp. DF-77]|uniref:LytR/AlgR family response regulator transcription factor n=1 Tax=Flagellimonas algarum TaxID=3230298 RepID=UPI003396F974